VFVLFITDSTTFQLIITLKKKGACVSVLLQ
jgi:hypothetical protein